MHFKVQAEHERILTSCIYLWWYNNNKSWTMWTIAILLLSVFVRQIRSFVVHTDFLNFLHSSTLLLVFCYLHARCAAVRSAPKRWIFLQRGGWEWRSPLVRRRICGIKATSVVARSVSFLKWPIVKQLAFDREYRNRYFWVEKSDVVVVVTVFFRPKRKEELSPLDEIRVYLVVS